jgi:hypothetical protein
MFLLQYLQDPSGLSLWAIPHLYPYVDASNIPLVTLVQHLCHQIILLVIFHTKNIYLPLAFLNHLKLIKIK